MKKKGKFVIFGDGSYLIKDQDRNIIKLSADKINMDAQEIEFEFYEPDVKETYHVVYPNSHRTFVSCDSPSAEEANKRSYGDKYGQVKFTITDGKLTGVEIV